MTATITYTNDRTLPSTEGSPIRDHPAKVATVRLVARLVSRA